MFLKTHNLLLKPVFAPFGQVLCHLDGKPSRAPLSGSRGHCIGVASQYIASHCNVLYNITLQCITLHYITRGSLHRGRLTIHYITLQCITSHCNTRGPLHLFIYRGRLTIHYITLQCITLHYIARGPLHLCIYRDRFSIQNITL